MYTYMSVHVEQHAVAVSRAEVAHEGHQQHQRPQAHDHHGQPHHHLHHNQRGEEGGVRREAQGQEGM